MTTPTPPLTTAQLIAASRAATQHEQATRFQAALTKAGQR